MILPLSEFVIRPAKSSNCFSLSLNSIIGLLSILNSELVSPPQASSLTPSSLRNDSNLSALLLTPH
jgi:hypothetical protein